MKADKKNTEQNYPYVSADKILSVCGQALSEQGIMVIPSITKWEMNIVDRGNGKARYDAVVDLLLKVTDGETSFDETWFGMGSDYAVPDKALYKAITSGHKYFLSKLFCIGEGNEDGEHEGEPAQAPQPAPKQAAPKPAAPVAPVTANIDAPTMTLVEAMNELSSEGELYGNLPTEKLAVRSNAIRKALASTPMSADERAERVRKHTAIGIILADREAKKQ